MHRVCIYCREEVGGSVSDLRSKKKGSNKSLNVGGSLMNIGNKQVGIKKLSLFFLQTNLSALLSLLLGLLDGDDLAILQGADCGHLAAIGGRLIEGFSELK